MAKRAPKEAPPEVGPLGTFGGYPVTEMAIALRNAGDGFTDALEIAQEPNDTGTEVFAVIRCTVGPIDHDPLTDQGKKAKGDELSEFVGYRRVEDWITQQAIKVDGDLVRSWLEDSATKAATIRAERAEKEALEAEKAAGIMRLVTDDEEDEG